MTEETSPIFDFYPKDFELDMNGKKQDWEAVVKIPFIDQARLLKAMARKSILFPSLSEAACLTLSFSPRHSFDRGGETEEQIRRAEHPIHL